jgi:hypothetical protein
MSFMSPGQRSRYRCLRPQIVSVRNPVHRSAAFSQAAKSGFEDTTEQHQELVLTYKTAPLFALQTLRSLRAW